MALSFRCNPRVESTDAPPIPLAGLWSRSYRATPQEPLINLAQGVPGAPPPPEFQQKLVEATADPETTRYGDLRGDEELRRALATDVNAVYGGTRHGEQLVSEDDIVITAGCNLAFYATMVTLAQAGDQVILPTPWYFNHQMTLQQLGISPIPLTCTEPAFLPDLEECRKLLTTNSRIRAIVLVTPNNPTGAIYPPDLLASFANLAKSHKVALVVDETYREFLPARPHNLFSEADDWRSYLIHLFSFSKSYAIPGHRLGAIIASPIFLEQANKTLDCLQICPARPAQRAVTWAVQGTRPWRQKTREEIVQRASVFREVMKAAEGWQVSSIGAYFAYVKHPFKGASSQLVASRLGEHVGIVVLPGSFFSPPFTDVEQDRFIRFSIANVSSETLRLVPARLNKLNAMWSTL